MNTPNKLTVLRVILIPVFLVFLLTASIPLHFFWALCVYCIACVTDTLDGYLARKNKQITDFGKLMDPMADKILVMAAMISFIPLFDIPVVVPIIILAREFLVASIRLVAAQEGDVIAADIFGKIKTITQMIWLVYGLVYLCIKAYIGFPGSLGSAAWILFLVMMWLSVLFTLISGFNYSFKNKKLFKNIK